MLVSDEFCRAVVQEFASRFTEDEIRNGYRGADVRTAQIAMEVFRLALARLEELPSQPQRPAT